MLRGLPENYKEFMGWGWEEIEPYAEELKQREITKDSIDPWLSDWSQLTSLINESFYRLKVRTTTHTNDESNSARTKEYSEKVIPNARLFEQKMKERFLESGLEPDGYSIPLRKMRTDSTIFREENLPLFTEVESLEIKQQEIEASCLTEWDGEELTQKQMTDKLSEPDRDIREKAWRLYCSRLEQDREAIDEIWIQFLDHRQKIAINAGFDDYRSYRWQELGRFDYSPDDCLDFHNSIEEVIVPVVTRMSERRKKSLGVEILRVWDDHWYFRPDPRGQSPLKPFKSIDELNEKIEKTFSGVDPDFGNYYRMMVEEGLLDLETRKHKSTGAYMEEFPASKRPFIFSNASFTAEDIWALLHEGGHAFHMFEAAHWPFHYQFMLDHMPMEFIEVGSMAMELLAYPYLTPDHSGLYSTTDGARAKIEHLEITLGFWPYMAVVDAFQHWVYENPADARDTRICDAIWSKLHKRFLPHLDWSGIEDTLDIIWRTQSHILLSPFYYVEYGLALLGAIQIWNNAIKDQKKAVQSYRKALSLGNTASLPDLFQAAGAKFAFDAGTLKQAVDLIEETIVDLEAKL